VFIGVARRDVNLYSRPQESGAFWGYVCTGGKKFAPDVLIEDYAEGARTGDIIGVLLEFDESNNATLTFTKNG